MADRQSSCGEFYTRMHLFLDVVIGNETGSPLAPGTGQAVDPFLDWKNAVDCTAVINHVVKTKADARGRLPRRHRTRGWLPLSPRIFDMGVGKALRWVRSGINTHSCC